MVDETAASLFRDLLNAEGFTVALTQFVEHETKDRVTALRGYIAQGDMHRAVIVEGELQVLADLPRLLKKHARIKY